MKRIVKEGLEGVWITLVLLILGSVFMIVLLGGALIAEIVTSIYDYGYTFKN